VFSLENYLIACLWDRLKYEKGRTIGNLSNRFRNSLRIYSQIVKSLVLRETAHAKNLRDCPKSLIERSLRSGLYPSHAATRF
jgi:hypothetical protein